MDVLNAVVTALAVATVGGLVTWAMNGKFVALEREIDTRFDAVDQRLDALDQRFDAVDRRFERLESSVDGLRSDLTRVALAVGARPEAQNG